MKGAYGAMLIALGIFVAIMGGYLLNAESVTTCETDWHYVTDVSGAFKGDKSDMDVDFSPSANVTGWSTTSGFNEGVISGVGFKPSSPNTYFVIDDLPAAVSDTLTYTPGDNSYSLTSALSGDLITGGTPYDHWTLHQSDQYSQRIRMVAVKLSTIMAAYSMTDYSQITITLSPSWPAYPGAFLQSDLSYHYASASHGSYYTFEGEVVRSIIITPAASVAQIGAASYALEDVLIGSGSGHALQMTISKVPTTSYVYMDPVAGVIPDLDTPVYWCNGYENSALTLMATNTDFDGQTPILWNLDFSVVSYDGLSSTNLQLEAAGGWWLVNLMDSTRTIELERFELGKWPAVSLVFMDGKIAAYPVSRFNSFGDYDRVDAPVVRDWDIAGGKTIGEIYIPPIHFDDAIMRLCVTSTVVHLREGGLYLQNGVFTLQEAFPEEDAIRLMLGSTAHAGSGVVFTAQGRSVLLPVSDDGLTIKIGEKWHPIQKVSFMWVSTAMPAETIGGTTYPASLYYRGGTYAPGEVWAEAEGDIVSVISGDDWSMMLEGVWAPAVFLYTGDNSATDTTRLMDFTEGIFRWDASTFIVTIMAVGVIGGLVGTHLGLAKPADWLVIIFAIGICWLIL